MSAEDLFDRALLRRRFLRAVRSGFEDFLLQAAIDGVCDRLGLVVRPFANVADIGTPSPELARRLATEGRLLTRMAAIPAALGGCGLRLVGDEEGLPFADASFDLAVSAFNLQSVNDLPGALIQIRRALKADGLFLACLLGGRSLHELRSALAVAETEVSGGTSPRVAPFADVRDMGGLLQRAGFALPVADSETTIVRYRDLFSLMADLRAMGATNSLVARRRRPVRRALFQRAAEIYAERFSDADGRIRATFDLVFISGWAPHESQQKPLRPGSAQMRLADALGGIKPPPQ
ncbi:class I SAM-dependent methyltransferase [Methylocella silvestris]|uniref:SAM-dependent methyltransferase n=1 Tax=Methylocella silvestris TaxID=199596 RepID=A0A2J7THJ9_METSI|nr:methyltransferase domain-containing protein [Methylocella silvestris]PNG26248.1 SAM-dependent methyltransferase [Methylocella silvestris]